MKTGNRWLLAAFSVMAAGCAHQEQYRHYERFDPLGIKKWPVSISWVVEDNVQARCGEIMKDDSRPYDACAVWPKDPAIQSCIIFTGNKNVSTAVIGHEIRHCFEGLFHP
jgi:hypothetical protein